MEKNAKEKDAPLTLEERFHSGKRPKEAGEPMGFSIDRRAVFAATILCTLLFIGKVPLLALASLFVVMLFIVFTVKDPACPCGQIGKVRPDEEGYSLVKMFSLYQTGTGVTGDTPKKSDDYDKFIDVLIKGGVIDNNTEPDDIRLTVVTMDPPTFELELNQIGTTEAQLISACQNARLAYSAYVVDVQEIGDTNYRIQYLLESEIDTLSQMGDTRGIVPYEQTIELYLTGGKYEQQ